MINSSQTTLARLLAKENIEVQHGNFRTAFFDVEKRILGLPLWKDRGKDVYDLLTGHEVGHALFTPPEGWHDSTSEIPGIPRSYVNVVEHVRIEKLVQRQYPGLVSSFKRGYAVLYNEDFFQVAGVDLSSRNVVDRINLKAKCRDLVEVEYSAKEQPIVDQVMAVETWEDVIEACKALYAFMKENQKVEEDTPQHPITDENDSFEDSLSSSDNSQDNSHMEDSEATEEDSEEDETPSGMGEVEPSAAEETRENSENVVKDDDIDRVESDEAFRENEHKLLDSDEEGKQSIHSNGVSRAQMKDIVIPYAKVLEARKQSIVNGTTFDEHINANSAMLSEYKNRNTDIAEELRKFEGETKPVVATMAKEFEMRKAAFRLQRAQTSRSGSINVNKLHSYRYNDDIFARITNLADAKSHGMVMFVDYSGSMSKVIGKVIRQTVTLADFCLKVNIPFVVYGFTTLSNDQEMHKNQPGGYFYTGDSGVFELMSSSLKGSDRKLAREILLRQSFDYDNSWRSPLASSYESLGSTPLYETILCAEYLIKDFKKTHGVQKVNAVFLTDGDGDVVHNNATIAADNNHTIVSYKEGYTVRMNGKNVKCSSRWDLGPSLMNELRNIEGVTTVGFFICNERYEFRSQMHKTTSDVYLDTKKLTAYQKLYNSNKFVGFDNVLGYDKYFVLNGKSLSTSIEEMKLDTDYAASATKAQITKAFKKHTSSKKGNKVLATQFATLVA